LITGSANALLNDENCCRALTLFASLTWNFPQGLTLWMRSPY
jgi:hypothetical protein